MEKYVVEINGQKMGLKELSAVSGLHYDTLRRRLQKGKPLFSEPLEFPPVPEHKEAFFAPDKPIGVYPNGYTFNELAELYKGFAEQPDELRMIMDFTGVQKRTAEKLLMQRKGVPVEVTKYLMGHEDISTTSNIYIDSGEPEALRAVSCITGKNPAMGKIMGKRYDAEKIQ